MLLFKKTVCQQLNVTQQATYILHSDLQPEEGFTHGYKKLPLGGERIATTITGTNFTYSTRKLK
jgi:hypothetical protein